MKRQVPELTCRTDYYTARQEGAVVIFSLKGNQLLSATILRAKEAIQDFLLCLENDPTVRIVLIMPPARRARREEYLSFFDMVRSARISDLSVMRLYRAIDQFVLQIMASDLFFIAADRGQILPMFASISLACDYRILGADAVFQNPALELGLISKGGTAWFLSRMLGRSKALELILAQESISVQQAAELGIANRCLPIDNFEADALAVAKHFETLPASSLRMAKRLVNNSWRDLPDYLEIENQELIKSLQQKKLCT